jgi:tetratricopeptide (TPR) repeat protein
VPICARWKHFVYPQQSWLTDPFQRAHAVIPSAPAAADLTAENDVLSPAHALRIGQQHYADGRIDEAIVAFRHGLEPAGSGADIATASELHAKLGNAYMRRGLFDLAGENYKAALRLSPHLAAGWCNLATIQLKTGKAQDAITLYLEALKRNPGHWTSRSNLAEALIATRQHLVAKALLMELAQERPQDGQIRHRLGRACFELNDAPAALDHFEQAIILDAADAESYYWIGAIRQTLGELEAAQAAYAQAAQIQPLIRRAAAKSPADFRVLALYAPFAGNTPAEYLFKDAPHDTDTLALLGDGDVDAAALGDVDVVVNLISDADQAEAVLPQAARLVEKLGKPVLNDPRKISRTTRDAVAALLPGIEGCRIPGIVRLDAGADVSVSALSALLPFSCPVLARPAGTHGGDDFEKIEDLDALSLFLAQRRDHDHYVIEYVDYASLDGYFRKYRFIFAGPEILPYHLAIFDEWKVHHDSTDMANQPWMQREEAAFLTDPAAVFTPAHYEALRAIRARTGLDYFGIDCAIDSRGDLLVFEVNASMLVHGDNAEFPYKDPAVRAIKQAFDAMLRQRALPTVVTAPPLSP